MTAGLKKDAKVTTLPFADLPHADLAGSLRRVFVRDMIIHTLSR